MDSLFLKKLESGIVLGDGAMGTQLYERGVYVNRNYDELNLTDSHLIKAIHRDYIQAGAMLIETNTFGANKFKLGKHGLAEHAFKINKAGAEIAKRCANEGAGVMVAGSIGPFGKPIAPVGQISEDEAFDSYSTQVKGLIAGEVDLFILETFLDLKELLIAIKAVREQSDLPVVAMMTIDKGLTAYGRTPQQVAGALNDEPVDVIGLNCSTGPLAILESIVEMASMTDKPLAVFPNAGEPKMVEGRIIYFSTPEYFAEYTKRMAQSGVRLVGGCCGTTPAHIKFMASAIRAIQTRIGQPDTGLPTVETVEEKKLEIVDLPSPSKRSPLGKLLEKESFPISCELHPPRSPNPKYVLDKARKLKIAGINAVNIPDGPRASARMSPVALAHLIIRETGMDAILHYTCRDRNILGMQSDLLGAEALQVNNILCVTGDPPKLGDYPMASAVFDVDAIGLLEIASRLNHGLDLAGNPIPKSTSFLLGAGFNPGAIDLPMEIDRLHKKIGAGAEYILTQPVFDQEILLKALDMAGKIETPIMVGILPLASYRNAVFFHNEVPGMDVPEKIRDRMQEASDKGKDEGALEGVKIAQEALKSVIEYVQGVYIMPTFGRVELAIETVSILPGRKAYAEYSIDDEEKQG